MSQEEILTLTGEVLDLWRKYEKTHNGQVRDKFLKKRAILEKEIDAIRAKRDPNQLLFEAS